MWPEAFFSELFEIRCMIESEAAFLAAQRGSDAEISAIEVVFDEMVEAERTTDEAIEADLRFHRQILATAHNPLLHQMGSLGAAAKRSLYPEPSRRSNSRHR